MLTKKLKKAWVKALRSRKYVQGVGKLRQREDGKTKYCCLGVFCDISGIGIDRSGENVAKKSGESYVPLNKILGDTIVTELYTMNDSQRKSFREIADYIDKNL